MWTMMAMQIDVCIAELKTFNKVMVPGIHEHTVGSFLLKFSLYFSNLFDQGSLKNTE